MVRRIVTILSACLILAGAGAIAYGSTTYVYNSPPRSTAGAMYKLAQPGIGIRPEGFSFYFTEQVGYDKLQPYVSNTLWDFNYITGLPFTLSGTIVSPSEVVQDGTVAVHYAYRPCHGNDTSSSSADYAGSGSSGTSCTFYYTRNGIIQSAAIWIDSEYFQSGSGMTTVMVKNLITHESGHAMGLTHPNTGGNWTCDPNADGALPVMCSPGTGGYTNEWAGLFTQWDWDGLMAVALNGALRTAGFSTTARR